MEENVFLPSLSLPGMYPSHLVTLSAAQGAEVVSRGWLVLCLFYK